MPYVGRSKLEKEVVVDMCRCHPRISLYGTRIVASVPHPKLRGRGRNTTFNISSKTTYKEVEEAITRQEGWLEEVGKELWKHHWPRVKEEIHLLQRLPENLKVKDVTRTEVIGDQITEKVRVGFSFTQYKGDKREYTTFSRSIRMFGDLAYDIVRCKMYQIHKQNLDLLLYMDIISYDEFILIVKCGINERLQVHL